MTEENNAINRRLPVYPTQKKFISDFAKHPGYFGGYGAGKSFAGTVKGIFHALDWNRGLPGLVVGPTYPQLMEANFVLYQELFEKLGIPVSIGKDKELIKMVEDDDSIPFSIKTKINKSAKKIILPDYDNGYILFRSADKPEYIKSLTVAWAHIDEVAMCPLNLWPIVVSRVRHPRGKHRQTFVTGTPEGLNWVYELWIKNEINGVKLEPEAAATYTSYTAHSAENKSTGSDYVSGMAVGMDEYEVRQKIHGEFVEIPMRGRIYKKYDPVIHVDTYIPNRGQWGLAVDFNVDPCLWIITKYDGDTLYAVDEIVLRDTNTMEMLEEAERRFRALGVDTRHVMVYGDASGSNRSVTSVATNYQIMRPVFPNQSIPKSNPRVIDRYSLTNNKLAECKIVVNPACEMLDADFKKMIYKEHTLIVDKSNHNLTHASDAFTYQVWRLWGRAVRRARFRQDPNIG